MDSILYFMLGNFQCVWHMVYCWKCFLSSSGLCYFAANMGDSGVLDMVFGTLVNNWLFLMVLY